MGKWSGWPLVRADVLNAEEALEREGVVSAEAWAALVWKWTGVPTADEFTEEGKHGEKRIVGLGLHDGERRVWYYAPADIAHQTGRWVCAVGYHQMRTWIALLADCQHQQRAWNYLHGQFMDYDPAEERPELVKARVDALRQRVRHTSGLTLISMEGE
jgi:hypothetical protein